MKIDEITFADFLNGKFDFDSHLFIKDDKSCLLNIDLNDYLVKGRNLRATSDIVIQYVYKNYHSKKNYFFVGKFLNCNYNAITKFLSSYKYLFIDELEQDLYEAFNFCRNQMSNKLK